MSVVMLAALLHHYANTDPWPFPSRSYDDALNKLKASDLVDVRKVTGEVFVTERGKVFVDMLKNTPLPVQKWADPRA
jgi:hypothetical protein